MKTINVEVYDNDKISSTITLIVIKEDTLYIYTEQFVFDKKTKQCINELDYIRKIK